MSPKQRTRSATGYYHIMQRGVGLFDIFEDDQDRNSYLEYLQEAIRDTHVELYAWCLMTNHTHLLVKAAFEALSTFMQQLGASYARYFNARHARPGHLFQGRYTSVPVSEDEQLLATIRYIHRNPLHHDGRTLCGDYPWSSYGEYVNGLASFTNTEMVLEMLGDIEAFRRFHAMDDGDRLMDIDTKTRMDDDEARPIAQEALREAGVETALSQLGSLPRAERNRALALVLSLGFSIRQVQRLTGINYSAVRSVAQSLSP